MTTATKLPRRPTATEKAERVAYHRSDEHTQEDQAHFEWIVRVSSMMVFDHEAERIA